MANKHILSARAAVAAIAHGDADAATVILSDLHGRLTRRNSSVVSTRLTNAQRNQVALLAAGAKCTVGELFRRSLVCLAKGRDPAGLLAELIDALGLPEDATRETIIGAISQMLTDESAPEDAMAESPDAPPPAMLSRGAANEKQISGIESAARAALPNDAARERFDAHRATRAKERAELAAVRSNVQARRAAYEKSRPK